MYSLGYLTEYSILLYFQGYKIYIRIQTWLDLTLVGVANVGVTCRKQVAEFNKKHKYSNTFISAIYSYTTGCNKKV